MRAGFKISILLNLALAACLLGLLTTRQQKSRSASEIRPSGPPEGTVSDARPARVESKTFRWNQLLAVSDYHAFIKNLRNIGCPEQTVRDIVSGDADRLFQSKRKELALDEMTPGPWSRATEWQWIADLLGEPSAPGPLTAAAVLTPPPVSTQKISYPLAFQNVDVDALGLNAGQKQVLDEIRQQFLEDIGGMNQDPNDPAYLQRWQKAKPAMDEMLKGMLGIDIFQNYQLQAGQSSQSAIY